LQDIGELHKAKQYFEKVLKIDRHSLGPENPEVAIDMNRLASVLTEIGEYNKADGLLKKAQEIYEDKLPENHVRAGDNLLDQAKLAIKKRDRDQAGQKVRTAKSIYLHNFNSDHAKVKEITQLQKEIKGSSQIDN